MGGGGGFYVFCFKKYKTAADRTRTPLVSLPSFSIHDLRRSAARAWSEYLKTDPHIIERMLNHQPLNKLIATYQRAVYVEEQKAAWHAWGEMVKYQISLNPGNIIPIKSSAIS